MNQANSDLIIRQCSAADLDALAPLFDDYRVFYGCVSNPALAHAFLKARLQHQQSVVFMALRNNGTPLGFTQLYPSFSSVSAARIFILNDLFVRPEARRCGAGSRLLKAAADFGASAGAVRLSLSTEINNLSAQALYSAHGWKRDDSFLHYDLALPPAA